MLNTRTYNIAKIIQQSFQFSSLKLSLNTCPNWDAVLKARNWSNILILTLQCCQINDSNMGKFVAYNWANLNALSLADNNLSEKGIELLLRRLSNKLQILNLNKNNIKNAGLLLIFRHFKDGLEQLYIKSCGLTQTRINQMNGFKLSDLRVLHLSQNPIGSHGIKWLIKIHLPKLIEIALQSCQIGDEGQKHISKAYWPFLDLLLSDGQNTLLLMSNHHIWKKVKEFNFAGTDIIHNLSLVLIPCRIMSIFFSKDRQAGKDNFQMNFSIKRVFSNRRIWNGI